LEDQKLAAYFKEYLDEEFRNRPLDATRAGDHRFDHLLDDVSAKARAANKARVQKTLAELPQRIAYPKLSRDGQIDFEICSINFSATCGSATIPNRSRTIRAFTMSTFPTAFICCSRNPPSRGRSTSRTRPSG